MEIIENVLNETSLVNLKRLVLTTNIDWKYLPNCSSHAPVPDPGFVHQILSNKSEINNMVLFQSAIHILGECAQRLDITVGNIVQSRLFMTLPLSYSAPRIKHTDEDYPHTVCLYYLTTHDEDDDDAKTCFFDKDGNLAGKITPVENRAIVFDGSIIHCGGNPKENERVVLNTCFTEKMYGEGNA